MNSNLDYSSKIPLLFELAEKSKLIVMLKLDGQRERDKFTVVVTGETLGDDFYRKDGSSMNELVTEAIEFIEKRSTRD